MLLAQHTAAVGAARGARCATAALAAPAQAVAPPPAGCAARLAPALGGVRLSRHRAAARGAAARAAPLVLAAAKAPPPTVADTKRKFVEAYRYPIPAVYSGVIQELLVSQHLARYNLNYAYSAVAALGFCSVYDQLMEGFSQAENKEAIFKAFVKALDENPEQYRKDASALAASASSAGGVDALVASEPLAALKARAAAGTLVYSKFVAIGLFRMLELGGATEPAALAKLVEASGVSLSKVNSDLTLYKGLLSKLAAAKELMAEFLEREKKKTEQRKAEQAAREAAAAGGPAAA